MVPNATDAQKMPDQDKAPAYLVYEFERRAYPLSETGFAIGRDAACDIVIREPSVSRTHAEVRAEAGEYVLHTSGTTGTRLNGTALTTPRQLKDGDRIEVGTAELTFRRAKLPLGVSVVDRAEPHADDITTRRETIGNPILGSKHHPNGGRNPLPLVVAVIIIAAVAGYYFLMR